MISEDHVTLKLQYDAENTALINYNITLIYIKTAVLNHNNISILYCIYEQINAFSVSKTDFIKNHNKCPWSTKPVTGIFVAISIVWLKIIIFFLYAKIIRY